MCHLYPTVWCLDLNLVCSSQYGALKERSVVTRLFLWPLFLLFWNVSPETPCFLHGVLMLANNKCWKLSSRLQTSPSGLERSWAASQTTFFYFRSEVFLQHMSVTHTDNTEQLHLFKKWARFGVFCSSFCTARSSGTQLRWRRSRRRMLAHHLRAARRLSLRRGALWTGFKVQDCPV